MLPFTVEQFLAVFADYNAAVWPAQVVAYGLGLVLWVALWRPRPWTGRLVGLGLAAMWLWTGVAYHAVFFAAINKAALVFGAMFVVQGLLLADATLRGDALGFDAAPGSRRWLGWALMAYAAVLYPLIGVWTGHAYPKLPMFGITPCPVTLFTLGVLLLAREPVPRRLLVIPLLWTLIGGSAAVLLGVAQDWLLLASAGVVGLLFFRSGARPHAAAV